MFAELLLPTGISTDRDEIEDLLVTTFGDLLEVTGAGTGVYGSNLDLSLQSDIESNDLVAGIRGVLSGLGIVGAKVRIGGDAAWTDL